MKYPIWEGVYLSFQEAPIESPGFRGEKWIQKSRRKIKALRDAAKEKKTVPTVTKYSESLLPVVASIVYNELGRLRILDFGGGMGFTFYQVARSLQRTENFEYHIVEVEEVCKAAYHFFKKEANIFSTATFQPILGRWI